jgi:hypothetical protein
MNKAMMEITYQNRPEVDYQEHAKVDEFVDWQHVGNDAGERKNKSLKDNESS